MSRSTLCAAVNVLVWVAMPLAGRPASAGAGGEGKVYEIAFSGKFS